MTTEAAIVEQDNEGACAERTGGSVSLFSTSVSPLKGSVVLLFLNRLRINGTSFKAIFFVNLPVLVKYRGAELNTDENRVWFYFEGAVQVNLKQINSATLFPILCSAHHSFFVAALFSFTPALYCVSE